ncbi:hypothetical protein Cni_G14886 [Canna indica]|uniref:Uncharacterized protein n=1 Tax=Canna indica TaxID=4628 RepID=A0AAQ3KDL6_9LILI|nr:hypothetical protein Cni_G14886 [Canna indica]
MRRLGQTSLPSSFFSKSRSCFPPINLQFQRVCLLSGISHVSRVPSEDRPTKPSNNQPVSLSQFLNRKIIKTTSSSLKDKQTSFSSIGSASKDAKKDGACDGFVLNDTVFRQFKVSDKGKEQEEIAKQGEMEEYQLESSTVGRECSSKRKNPFDDPSGPDERLPRKSLIILGDDPKPWPYRRGKKMMDNRSKPIYDHYANGSGWWDCSKEGIDNEEVGCSEFWESMGSTTLGGLEWH